MIDESDPDNHKDEAQPAKQHPCAIRTHQVLDAASVLVAGAALLAELTAYKATHRLTNMTLS